MYFQCFLIFAKNNIVLNFQNSIFLNVHISYKYLVLIYYVQKKGK